jgi:thymidylate kinase
MRDDEFRVPQPELELALLVIRLVLKHVTWDAKLARRGPVSGSARAELAALEGRADEGTVPQALERWLPRVDAATFAACRRALDPRAGTREGIRAGRLLLAALQPYARRPRAADVSLKLWRRGAGIARRLSRRPPRRKRLAGGGAVVAVVGADGAGKSTVVEALSCWLSQTLAVETVHLGKPSRSPASRGVRALGDITAAVVLVLRRGDRSGGRALKAVALARDRSLAARRVRKLADDGWIVVCDRYPLPQLTLMDAPRLASLGTRNRALRGLSALEQRYYRELPLPDTVIVLRADPETAVARKPDEPAEFVRARWRDIWEADWTGQPYHLVDADRPASDVVSEVKALVWSEL